MPLTFPPAPTVGQTYTDANSVVWQFDGIAWNVVTGTVKKLFNGVQVGLAFNAYLTTTATAIVWDDETYDTNNYWTMGQPTRITIPSTGYYVVNTVLFTPNVGAGYQFMVKKNGATNLVSVTLNANQSAEYNEINYFSAGEYLEIYASESTSSGYVNTDTFLSVTLQGLAVGSGVSAATAFSGAKTTLTADYNTGAVATALAWNNTVFDVNANALALTYWSVAQPSRLTVQTSGFYQIETFMETKAGVGGDYTISLKKNGSTTISTTTVPANEVVTLDQIYQLTANDYIEIYVNDTLASGQITADSYLQIQRLGIA